MAFSIGPCRRLVEARRPSGLFLYTLGWALLAAAGGGGIIGFALGVAAFGEGPVFLLVGPLIGIMMGSAIGLVPALLAAAAVTEIVRRCPPETAFNTIRWHISWVFVTALAIVNALVVLAAFVAEDGSYASGVAVAVAVADLCMAPFLMRARTAIARTWTGFSA